MSSIWTSQEGIDAKRSKKNPKIRDAYQYTSILYINIKFLLTSVVVGLLVKGI
jgi:hypothetical protein